MRLEDLLAWLYAKDRDGKDRTRRIEAAGCLVWQGAVSFQIPKAHIPGAGGRTAVNLRRLVLEAKLGRKLERAELATYTCGQMYCLEPGHLYPASRLEVQRRSSAEGRFSPEMCSARSKKAAAKRVPKLFTKRRVRELLMAVHRGEAITTAARSRGMGVRTLQRILSWEIPALLGMDRAREQARLEAGISPDAEIHVTVAPTKVHLNRWMQGDPPPRVFSSVPLGAFADGAQA